MMAMKLGAQRDGNSFVALDKDMLSPRGQLLSHNLGLSLGATKCRVSPGMARRLLDPGATHPNYSALHTSNITPREAKGQVENSGSGR